MLRVRTVSSQFRYNEDTWNSNPIEIPVEPLSIKSGSTRLCNVFISSSLLYVKLHISYKNFVSCRQWNSHFRWEGKEGRREEVRGRKEGGRRGGRQRDYSTSREFVKTTKAPKAPTTCSQCELRRIQVHRCEWTSIEAYNECLIIIQKLNFSTLAFPYETTLSCRVPRTLNVCLRWEWKGYRQRSALHVTYAVLRSYNIIII